MVVGAAVTIEKSLAVRPAIGLLSVNAKCTVSIGESLCAFVVVESVAVKVLTTGAVRSMMIALVPVNAEPTDRPEGSLAEASTRPFTATEPVAAALINVPVATVTVYVE